MAHGMVCGPNMKGVSPSVDIEPTVTAEPYTNGAATAPHAFRELCTGIGKKIADFLEETEEDEMLRSVQAQTRNSLGIIQEALACYPSLQTLSLSYNGGKDCLLLLYLYLSVLSNHPDLPNSLPAIYIPHHSPFPTLDAFVEDSARQYHLNVARYEHKSMREAFRGYLDDEKKRKSTGRRKGAQNGLHPETASIARNQEDDSGIEAIFVGTRRTDPHGGSLQSFTPTDGGWPKFMRILPVLEWKYPEVWTFLRHFDIPYCELYDLGYTSLGGTNDTHPNPALKLRDGNYLPAYELKKDEEERLGREGGG